MQHSLVQNDIWRKLFRDARHFQIGFLAGFLFFGILALNWEADFYKFGLYLGSCLIFQVLGCWLWGVDLSSLKSALISALGLCLLLKTDSAATMVFASAITILGKFVIRVNDKHVFNPVNLGIVGTVVLTGQAWISPGQWGSDLMLLVVFGTAAVMVLLKVGRLDISLSFLSTYLCLEFLRSCVFLSWPTDYLSHLFLNGTLLLFTFFMITDPRTTPDHPKARIIWAVSLAIIAFVLGEWLFIYTAPIWALFIMSPFTPLFDTYFKHNKFNWI